MNSEILDYLTNFWDHSVGSTVTTGGGGTYSIIEISSEDESQVRLNNSNDWHFIQDLTWNPSIEEANHKVFTKLGVDFFGETIRFNKIFKPIPTTFEELYDCTADIRSHLLTT